MDATATTAEWIECCAVSLQKLAPGLDDVGADEYARLLHGAWPALNPDDAVRRFLSPEPHPYGVA
jgi:hypothetical protein